MKNYELLSDMEKSEIQAAYDAGFAAGKEAAKLDEELYRVLMPIVGGVDCRRMRPYAQPGTAGQSIRGAYATLR